MKKVRTNYSATPTGSDPQLPSDGVRVLLTHPLHNISWEGRTNSLRTQTFSKRFEDFQKCTVFNRADLNAHRRPSKMATSWLAFTPTRAVHPVCSKHAIAGALSYSRAFTFKSIVFQALSFWHFPFAETLFIILLCPFPICLKNTLKLRYCEPHNNTKQ